jgi:KAP family P-loop domain
VTQSPYSEVPAGTGSQDGGAAASPAPDPVARTLVIPERPLAIPADEAIDLLNERIHLGESIRRPGLFRAATARRRDTLRWHEENAGLIEGMFEEPRPTEIRTVGRPVYSNEVLDLLDSETRQLSSLRERLVVRRRRPILSASSSGGDPEPAEIPAAEEQPGGFSASDPSKTTESAATSAPQRLPETAPESDEATDGLSPLDELRDVASRPVDQAALRDIAIATAASAALPAYDADAVSTRDFIGIDAVADAFSYLLASRNAQPPLAIGLFGEWGSGKSFLMQSIKRRIDEITRGARQSGLPQSKIGVYKRVVQVEFNAWHYVEGNLWASLVDHIFANLRVTPSESLPELERRRIEISRRMVSTTQQRIMLNKRISSLDDKRRRSEQEAAVLREGQLRRLQELRKLRLSDVATAAKLNDSEKKAVSNALGQIGLDQVGDTAIAAAQSLTEARALVHRGGAILAPLRGKGVLWLGAIIAAILAAPIVAFALQKWNVSAVPKVLTSLAATASCAIVYFRQSLAWASGALSRIETAEAQVRARVNAETEKQAKEVAQLEQAIGEDQRLIAEAQQQRQDVDKQIAALQREVRELTPGKILAEFLDQRATSLDYQKHLGLTALIRRDFEKLTTLVAEANAEPEADQPSSSSVADFSRVILFVDDLDRCPPRRVVEVLQAVHLLLSFPVFAVVVAVDPRWLSRSLQEQYRGLIEGRASDVDASTAQDYLEKIFQIPYRVAPLDSHSRALFMGGLVSRLIGEPTINDPVAPADFDQAPQETQPLLVPSGDGDDPAPAPSDAAESKPQTTADAFRKRKTDNGTSEVDLNPASLQLDDDEVRFLGELLPVLDSSPRGLKRYINIYRLIKTVVGEPSASRTGEAQRRMFLLAVLTAFPYGSDVINYIIDSPSPHTQFLGDRITEYFNQRRVDHPGLSECKTLTSWVTEHTAIAGCPIFEMLEDARHVRLYSFT